MRLVYDENYVPIVGDVIVSDYGLGKNKYFNKVISIDKSTKTYKFDEFVYPSEVKSRHSPFKSSWGHGNHHKDKVMYVHRVNRALTLRRKL